MALNGVVINGDYYLSKDLYMNTLLSGSMVLALFMAFSTPVIAEQTKRNMAACVTEELLDELLTYSNKGDTDGMEQLFRTGKCTYLSAGTTVSVIDQGFMVATVRFKCIKLFTPSEAIR